MMSKLTLVIGNKNYSSWSLRAWLAMKQAGVKFTEIKIPLDTPITHQEILKYSPTGLVPVLLDGDIKVWESLAICEYVAEKFANDLWPKNPEARAVARAISAEMHAGFPNLRKYMPMDCRGRYPEIGIIPEVRPEIERVGRMWRECREKFGAEGDMLFGKFTIADAIYAPVVSRFATYQVKLEPVAQAYAEAVWALADMQEWLAAAAVESETIFDSKF
ncbi:glutathione S-transferase family protein [Okeania sp. SIO1I7]|uniref:glutathione S-transferase family protein n=1 Tax=Okeania sp. SIO1I7 TaxID=2607772 RepID=UPI0025DE755C|nr:glutathione S-transferase family protein [Okeania sp. SIO1I7]